MNSHITVVVHKDRLHRNFKAISEFVGKNTGIIPVIKADGYGHGMIEVAKELKMYDNVTSFGVAHTKEAVMLRKSGIRKDILVMSCIDSYDFEIINSLNITPVVHSIDLLEKIVNYAKKYGKNFNIHLKFNTGMSRLGIDTKDVMETARICKAGEKYITLKGLMSHFSDSENDSEWTKIQNDRFSKIVDFFNDKGFDVQCKHIANSGAILQHKSTYFDCVRPGLILYGYAPSKKLKNTIDLIPVLDVKSQLVSIHTLKKGEGISYGRTFIADKDMRIGVVAFGYADGLFRNLSNKMECLINGQRCPGVGTVCMDMFMCDISDKKANIGDDVFIIGTSGNETITADEIAGLSGTISYEVLTNIGKSVRVKRSYTK